MHLDDDNQPQQNSAGETDGHSECLPIASSPGAMEPPAASPGAQVLLPPRQRTFEPALPEDLRVPWGWLDLLLLVVVAIAGTFVLSMFIVMGFAFSGVSFHQLQDSIGDKNLLLIINQALLSVALLIYLSAQMRLSFGLPFWRTIGWRPPQPRKAPRPVAYLGFVLSGFLLAVLVSLGSSAFHTKTQLPIEQFFQDRTSALLLMLLGVLVAPVLEETIFRGYIYPVAARSFGVLGRRTFHWHDFWPAACVPIVGRMGTDRSASRGGYRLYLRSRRHAHGGRQLPDARQL